MSEKAYKEMSADELQTELLSLTKEQFNLRIQNMTNEMSKPHLIKRVRRNIARVKTRIAELKRVGK